MTISKLKGKITLGVLPTQRYHFGSINRTQEAKQRILHWLKQEGVSFVDLEGVTDEGTLHSMKQKNTVVEYLKSNNVDALFVPHCNFGSEEIVASVARDMKKPVLIWGEKDDIKRTDFSNVTDRQCGLFATSKILRRYNVSFTYIVNSKIDSPVFTGGFSDFLAAVNVVKSLRNLRIGQIGTRPAPFLTVMNNEGELAEKFGIEIVPTTLGMLVENAKMIEGTDRHHEQIRKFKEKIHVWEPDEEATARMAAFKLAIQDWADDNSCNALVIQCWSTIQQIYQLSPCFINSELAGEGLPVGCESDVHGVITSVMLEAAMGNELPSFFADLTTRHPENENAELLWHCGPYPHKLIADGVESRVRSGGQANWRIRGGELTLARFDGDHGEYSLFMGNAKAVDGPESFGTYLWAEVDDWPRWEKELIYGPYIHHIVGIHGNVVSILEEASRYIPELKTNIMR